jgi:hypothetical protein
LSQMYLVYRQQQSSRWTCPNSDQAKNNICQGVVLRLR